MIPRLPLLSRIIIHKGNVALVAADMGTTRQGIYTAGPIVRSALVHAKSPNIVDFLSRALAKSDRINMNLRVDYTNLYHHWLTQSVEDACK